MPKRVVDGEAVWRSDKIASLSESWMRPEFANLVPLALANGSFECSPRLIWSQVYAYNRPEMTPEMVERMLAEYERVKLLYRWKDPTGKLWGFWIGIEKPGRLPNEARRKSKHEKRGAEVPKEEIEQFLTSHPQPSLSHDSTNGQRMADHGPTNGDIGFGFGSCSGIGIGNGKGQNLLSEQKDCSDVKKGSRSVVVSDEGKKLASLLKDLILSNNPKHKPIGDRQLQQWGHEADLMVRADGRTHSEIVTLIRWTQADNFEKANVLSMGKLRQRFDQLTVKNNSRSTTKKPNGSMPLTSIDHTAGTRELPDGTRAF